MTTPSQQHPPLDQAQTLQLAREIRSADVTRSAVMSSKNVMYVKGVKLIEYVTTKKGKDAQFAANLGNELLKSGLVVKAEVIDRKKKALRPSHKSPLVFEPEAFLVWTFEGSTSTRNALFILVALAFFGLVLFPVWPQSAKVGVWYVSMTLLLILLGFILLRLVLFLVLYGVGIDFWILPNFFADDMGFWDSFRPKFSFSASLEDIKTSWPYRLAVLFVLLGFGYWVYTQPTEFDQFVASQRAFVDELYEGTLLSDRSQAAKDAIDKTVPDVSQLEKELKELEEEEAKRMSEMIRKHEQEEEKERGDTATKREKKTTAPAGKDERMKKAQPKASEEDDEEEVAEL